MTCPSSCLDLDLGSYSFQLPIYVPNTWVQEGRMLEEVSSGQAGIHSVGFKGESHTSKWSKGVIDSPLGLLMVGGRTTGEREIGTFFQVSVSLPSVDSLNCLHIWMWTLKYCWPMPESQDYPAVLLIFPYDWISWIIMLLSVCAHMHTWIFWHISQKC